MTGYLMDHPDEGERIEQKTDVELTLSQFAWTGLAAGMRALDLGCAAGTSTRLMGGLVGSGGTIVGVDASVDRIVDARARTEASHVEFRVGVAEDIPAEDDSFDVSWSRFLFEYVQEPRCCLREMIRVTKPGGTVAVSDLDGNCVWHAGMTGALQEELAEVIEIFGSDFNPRVGRELPAFFLQSELVDVCVDVRPYNVIVGSLDGPALSHWRMKLVGVREGLVRRGWLGERADRFVDQFLLHLRNPRSFSYSTLVSVKGMKPSCF